MKKGFTLIELLAVIVVLAVIAVIAIPIITNVIESAKEGAFKSSVLNGYNSVEITLLKNKKTEMPLSGLDVSSLNLKNNFKSGKYKKRYDKIIAYNITDGKYCANGDINNLIITKGNCSLTSELKNTIEKTMLKGYGKTYHDLIDDDIENNEFATEFHQQIYREKIKTIHFVKNIDIPLDKVIEWDVSYKGNNMVKAWLVDNANPNYYDLYIGSNDIIYASYDASYLFYGMTSLVSIDFSNFNTSYTKYLTAMFQNCTSLININLNNFDTENATYMYSMFENCTNLTKLDLSSFDTKKITNMYNMFRNCSNLKSINLTTFDTSVVENMYAMFKGCGSLESLSLDNFNTSNVIGMGSMFEDCSSLISLDLSSFNTSNVADMSSMFSNCSNLNTINLNTFDTSNVTTMTNMFSGCDSIMNLDLSSFNTSNVNVMWAMFANCSNLTNLDLSNFNTMNVTNMSYMFANCSNLTTIYRGSNWVTAAELEDMFAGCGTSTLTLKS